MAAPAAVSRQASHSAGLRPKKWAKAPAKMEERKAPRVRREPISCWKVLCVFLV
jgi:hypothetical protein